MAERDVTLRLAVADAERAIRDLKAFGDRGEDALKRLSGASQPASRGLQTVNTAAVAAGRSLTVMQAAVAGLAGGLALYLNPITALGAALTIGVRNSEAAEQSFLRLEGVLRATGQAAGLTAQEISGLANELERSTLQTSEQVNDAAAVLATFRSISGDVFTDALRTATDLSAVFGNSLTGAATQLGKALEDPIRGVSALREVGVSFTRDQQEVIRALVETGEVAEAQRVILQTLEEQVGGAAGAEAGGLTGAFSRARAAAGDFLQSLAEQSGVTGFLTQEYNRLAEALDRLSGADFVGSPLQRQLALAQQELDQARAAAAVAGSGTLTPSGFARGLDGGEEARRVEELTQKVFDLQSAVIQETRARGEARRAAEQQAVAREEDAAIAREQEAAAKAAETAEKARATATAAAAREAEALAAKRRDAITALAVEVDQQQRLREALAQSGTAYAEVARAIEIENELRALGLDLTTQEGRELARLVGIRQDEAEALEQTRAARERLARAEDDRLRRMEDRGFDPAAQSRDMAQRAAEAQRAVEREREAAISRQVAALDGAIDRIGQSVSNIVRDLRLGLVDGAEDFAAALTDALASVPEQLIGTAFTSLFDGVIADFSAALRSSVGPGGELDFSALFGAFNNPLGAATLGAFGGSLAANQFGIGGPFSGLGGGVGAGLGFVAGNALLPGVGGFIGAGIGGLAGTLLGGLFGGGGERDNVGTRIDLATLAVDAGGTPNANTARANQLGQTVAAVITGLRTAGVDFDANGQIRFNVNNTRSDAQVLSGATRQLLERSSASDPILAQVLASTRAQSPEALLADVQFGRLFEQLTDAITPAEVALRELNVQFDEAARKAEQLGLDEQALAEARQRATDELVRTTEEQVRSAADSITSVFAARIDPLRGALDQFAFGPGSALGVEAQLGLARIEFDQLRAQALAGGDVDFNRLASLGTQVVGLARELDASGSIFQQTFADVDSVFRELIAEQTAQQDDLLSAFSALELGQRDQTTALADRLDRLIDSFEALTRQVELQGRVA